MSVQTVTATRIYTGKDEKFDSPFDKLPTAGFSKTYCVDAQVPDSACTATAYHTGVKTLMGNIAMDARAKSKDCVDHANEELYVTAISQWAHDAGMNLGLITTSRVTDASPSPLFASSTMRFFETDQAHRDNGCDPDELQDISEQLVHGELGKQFKVILGGGRSMMLDKSIVDEEGVAGARGDGKNLIADWKQIHEEMGETEYVWNREQLLQVNTSRVDYLLGFFEGGTMKFNYKNTDKGEPSLSEMVEVAIEILSRDGKGFYLFVEGGLIDYGNHYTKARVALDETKCLGEAVEMAQRKTSEDETLIVVSADHAHTLTINGWTARKSDILGLSDTLGKDGLPLTTLSYSMGKGYVNTFNAVGDKRVDISGRDLTDFEFEYQSTLNADLETHAGDDVPVYAGGPYHEIFAGAYEQNALPYLMAYAAKIGPYKGVENGGDNGGGVMVKGSWIGLVVAVIVAIGVNWKEILFNC